MASLVRPHFAIYEANPAMVQWLIDKGANPLTTYEISDLGTVNALMYAVHLGIYSKKKSDERYAIAEMLSKAGGLDDTQTVSDAVIDSGNERYINLLGFKVQA